MVNQPFIYQAHVHSEWVDYNGHMNDAAYAKVFSLAVDEFIDYIGLDAQARTEHAYTIFTLETHLCYLQEANEGEQLHVEVQLMDDDAKRLHVFFTMKNASGDLVATSEQMLMGMDTDEGRPAPFPEPVAVAIKALREKQANLEVPKQVGRRIGIKRK
ncbi:acyl-CoA thioester hydrolase [Virgibacillus natechei]|uniref:Acyl-CoA thioester hydrolase n=1 Tax=Virgibacillus natechei TaxID=1216297 RepID=A0ABS4IBL9_9BACI|nr:thioesterase family protein [Virgibacillus natechei]MBP1968327.1 acyl-CoA thioester hydrolase [Virgibacillus natechei]UZD13461.1 thioesterase family protein [Virgibacillus natechei]